MSEPKAQPASGEPRSEQGWPSPVASWYLVAVLMIAYINSFIDRTILALLVEPIRADLGITDTQISLLHGFAFAIFYTLMGIPIATLADRKNRRNIIAIGMTFWSLATAACGLARGFWSLFLARVGVGVGEAALSPAAYSMIADSFPQEKLGRALGIYSVGAFIGAGIAFIIGGLVVGLVATADAIMLPIIGAVKPWQMVFFIVGLPGLLLSAWVMTLREPVRRVSTKAVQQQSGFRTLLVWMRLHWRAFTAHLAGFSLLGLLFNSTLAWMPTHMIRSFELTASQAGLWLGTILLVFSTVGILVGSFLSDWLSRRGRSDATMLVGLISAVCLVPFAFTATTVSSLWLCLLLFCPLIFFSTFAWGAAAAAIQVITPNRMRATASAIYLFFLNLIGIGFGPTLVALCTDYLFRDDAAVGNSIALVAGISAPLAGLLFWWGLASFRRTAEGLRNAA